MDRIRQYMIDLCLFMTAWVNDFFTNKINSLLSIIGINISTSAVDADKIMSHINHFLTILISLGTLYIVIKRIIKMNKKT